MQLRTALVLGLGLFVLCPLPRARAQTHNVTPPAEPIGIEEKLGQFVPLDLGFVDADGDSVYLKDIIGRPTVLTLVYYHCIHVCIPLLSGVAEVVSKTDLKPGVDYDLLTISFDPLDNPETASNIRKSITSTVQKEMPADAWRFLTGDSASIAAITDAVGFRVKRVEGGYAHGIALIVLSPNGKVVRYLYGMSYLPFDLKMAVSEAAEGKVVPSVARVLKFCFSYDPKGRTYVLNVTRVVGTFVILLAAIFVLVLVALQRKGRRARA